MTGKIVAVASGKGGVGKTWLSITLAHHLAKQGKKVILFDGDFGLANVDVQLGLTPNYDLGHVIYGQKLIPEIIEKSPDESFDIIPGGSGVRNLANIDTDMLNQLAQSIQTLKKRYDYVILDLAAGIYDAILKFTQIADDLLVIINQEPTSLTDAYALIKLRVKAGFRDDIHVLVNQSESPGEAERSYEQLQKACRTFLNTEVDNWGYVRREKTVIDTIKHQELFLTRYPTSMISEDMASLGEKVKKSTKELA